MGTGEVRRRSNTDTLEMGDVWYTDQGVYRCVASNNIGNKRRELQSEPITIDVTGKELFIHYSTPIRGMGQKLILLV